MVFAVRKRRDEIESQLDTLRRSYRFFSTLADPVERERMLNEITQVAEWYKGQLAQIPDYKDIRTLRQSNMNLLELWVQKLITLLAGSVNVGKNIKQDQIEDIAISVITKFGDLTLEDISLCFVRIKDGGFGELFDVLDGPKLLFFLAEYEKDIKAMRQNLLDKTDEAAEFTSVPVRIPQNLTPGEKEFREAIPAKISDLVPINLERKEINF